MDHINEYSYELKYLIRLAAQSTCKRSKCASIITNNGAVIGQGYNSMPCDQTGECFKDTLPSTFKSDKTCCVHAEQRAIINALQNGCDVKDSSLFFLRFDENMNPQHAGKPYCTICSKMALDVGISKFYLWHEQGWTAYDTKTYNELSFIYK